MARGICPVCGREFDITRAGVMRFHYSPEHSRDKDDWSCPGVGQPPKLVVGPLPLQVGEHAEPCPHDRPGGGSQSAACVKLRGHDTHWNGRGDAWRTDDEAYVADVAAAEQRGRQWAIDALRNRYSLGWDAWCVGKRRYLAAAARLADWLEHLAKESA